MKLRNHATVIAVYLAVIAATLALATLRPRAQGEQPAAQASPTAAAAQPSPTASPAPKPYFSLTTNRTYGTHEKARVYISYQAVNSLDFRVYQIRDPFKFFKQLANPHQMGEEEREEIAEVAEKSERKPSFLEKFRSFKNSIRYTFKSYFRSQLKREARTAFNDKFRAGEQIQLNAADYARVPVLNQDQLVKSWRQILTPLENKYDTRMVSLDKRAPGVYLVEAVNGESGKELRAYTIAVVTDLTMITKVSADGEALVYAVDRRTGEPRDGAKIEIVNGQKSIATGQTDGNGIMRTRVSKPALAPQAANQDADAAPPEPDPDQNVGPDGYLIMASRKDDFAISDLESYLFEMQMGGEGAPVGKITGYIYTDRPVYRPEQKAYFKGILRRLGEGGYEMPSTRTINVTVTDGEGNEILRKDLPLSARGTFNGEVDIAANAPLGGYSVVVNSGGNEAARGFFEVAEYKKPEYKVRVATPKTFVMAGEKTSFTVEAKYFFGAPVKNADVKYYIYRSRYYPWWWEQEDDGIEEEEAGDEEGGYGYGNDLVKEGAGRLGEDGRMEIPFDVPQPGKNESSDFTYRLEAMVTDAARREIEGRASFIGIRSNTVVNVTTDRYVYYQGDTARIRVETKDREGKPQSNKVTLKFVEVKYERYEEERDGQKLTRFKPVYNNLSSTEVTTTAAGEAIYDYRIPVVGYIDVQTFVNENGRQVEYHGTSLYVTDRNNAWADTAYRDHGSIKLVLDKKSYQPGETAKVLALLPTEKAHLLVTTELTKVLEARHVFANGRAVMIDVPIKENFVPNIYLSVAYVRDGEMHEQSKSLNVPAQQKFLNIEILPDKKEYKPRDPASYTIVAHNADGSPAAGAEVSLGVVDEAIYSIRPDTSGDIRKIFYGTRYSNVSTSFSSAFGFTGYSGNKRMELAQNKRAHQLADFKNESQLVEPKIRKEFKDTAFWQPEVLTGADGRATVKLNLPDNLTTWRATARAVTADLKVGASIARVVARKDLILRLETPRFLTEGDTVTISGIVHNYLNADKAAKIKLEVNGAAAKLIDAAEQTVTVPRQGETRIDWRVQAAQVGQISLVATAKTDVESDGIELPLPITPAGLKQTRGGSAAMAEESAEKVFNFDVPPNANAIARSLRIEAAPSIAGALFGALDYLTTYPYGCVEQTMSSFLPNVIVAQTLKEVKTSTLQTGDLNKKVQRGLDRLYNFQHEDGGWGWWKDDPTDPFMTAYVMDGLTMAKRANYAVENYRLEQGRAKLKALLDAGKMEDGTPFDLEARTYLLYALQASGNAISATDARYANDLYNRRSDLQPFGRALLALTLKLRNDENRARLVAGDIERTARATDYDAHWPSKRRPMLDFSEENDLEATALSLKAIAQINPQSQLVPKAARWLVANRRHGYYWQSTKHTAFAIYALTDYLKVSKELTADYTVEVYLNNEPVLTRRVTAAEAMAGQPVVIERKGAAVGGSNQIRVVKRGNGVAYVAATLDYFTKEENTPAQATPSLKLAREYLRLRVTDNNGQLKWAVEPLSGELRSGDLIVAKLRVTGAKAQYLLLEDPIPAGCEQVERFSGLDLNRSTQGWSDYYSQREFRDQRTALFLNYFDGDATFQYALRVQIPGEFKVAPARAELMYQPTVQANTENVKLSILDKK